MSVQKKDEVTDLKHTRSEAWTLLNQFTESPSLLKHALAVEACMRAHGEAQAAARRALGFGTGLVFADAAPRRVQIQATLF